MKYHLLTCLCLLLLALNACKNKADQAQTKTSATTETASIEALIQGFTVRDSAGIAVKDSLRGMQAMRYSDSGKEVSNIFYNLDGTVAWEDRYLYNEQGFKSGSRYFEDGEHLFTYKYDLDAQGRRIGFVALEAKTAVPMYKGFSSYEQDGKLRKDGAPGPNGVVKWNYEYMFDEQGEETGYAYITKDGSRFESSYRVLTRDDQGRWTKRGIVENDTVVAIETREFREINK